MPDVACPHCNAVQLRQGLEPSQRIRCEDCQEWFNVGDNPESVKTRLSDSGRRELEAARDSEPVSVGVEAEVTIEGETPSVREMLSAASGKNKYAVEGVIAEGGMGRILRARDRDIRRIVAMKVIREAPDEDQRHRFVEEAQITGQLEHPNIVPVHDLGVDEEGRLFFTMKLVRGRSLESVLDSIREGDPATVKDFALPRLLRAMLNVCYAVAYAHGHHVVHRDLKPANIMLGDYGAVQLMDWGLAKLSGQPARPPAEDEPEDVRRDSTRVRSFRSELDLGSTRYGTVAGTPAYMAPEQARGDVDAIDARTDIYALGAILYEILTLYPPVMGSTETEIIQGVQAGKILQPEMRAPTRKIPRELSTVVMKALSSEPGERYQSVSELQKELTDFLDGLTVTETESDLMRTFIRLGGYHKGASFLLGVATTAIIAVVGVGYYMQFEERERLRERLLNEQRLAREEAEKKKALAPSLFEMAKREFDDNQFDRCLLHLDVAVSYDPDLLEARMMKAQLLFYRKRFAEAINELEAYLKKKPGDTDALRLMEICKEVMRGRDENAPS